MQQPYMNFYFGNPGPYQISLNIHFQSTATGNLYNYPAIGMPQQQQALEYGQAPPRQFGNNCVPYNNNGYCFPRAESGSSLLETSYSSGMSTPGIVSDSWSYNSPHQIYYHPMNRNHHGQQMLTDTSINNGCEKGNLPATSTPTSNKAGCFSMKNCAII